MIHALKKPAPVQNRGHDRFDLEEPCIVQRWGRDFHAVTRNISAGGMCLDIQGMGSTALDAYLTIILRDFEPIIAAARWSNRRTFGLQFVTKIENHPELGSLLALLKKA